MYRCHAVAGNLQIWVPVAFHRTVSTALMPSKGEAGGSKEVIEDGDKEGKDERGGQAAAVHADIEAEDVGEGGAGEQAREREIWLDGENGLKVKEGSRDWKSPWRYLTGYGWRTDIPVRLHRRWWNDCMAEPRSWFGCR
jgi:hypothetical protein